MGMLSRFRLDSLSANGITQLIETGTGDWKSITHALELGWQVATVEISADLYETNRQQFEHQPNFSITLGNDNDFLLAIAPQHPTPRLFWLNSNLQNGINSLQQATHPTNHPAPFVLQRSLEILLDKDTQQDWIIIDNARLYVEGMFGHGKCPETLQQFSSMSTLRPLLERFSATHDIRLCRQDEGYFVLAPKTSRIPSADIIKVLPTDPPGEEPGVMPWTGGVLGCTSISIARRIRDHRFTTRYFKGYGLDVGCGNDSLARYVSEFFPLVRNIATYDMPQGDAQKLVNVEDNSFDFLYSSHCLEHLRDAREALHNWIRVVKPGGYLVVQIPDEDLYEQGFWPSRYNGDHKITFTIAKTKSWSPASVNVLDLLAQFVDQVAILQLGQEDAGYQYRLQPYKFDQTRTPMAESAIEFVLQKRS
ncbi:MAG: class I SAM-dependent methyltransferase [Methylophilaceae bacterium]|nr:class I SAM-dependent methyltransferase [Methylophilaceae bacterium]